MPEKKPTRVGRRLSEHPKVTAEKLAEIKKAGDEEDAFYLSAEGREELRRRKENVDQQITRHGGRRRGAGRPKLPAKKPTLSFTLSEELRDFLQSQENKSAFLESVLRRSAAFRSWKSNTPAEVQQKDRNNQ